MAGTIQYTENRLRRLMEQLRHLPRTLVLVREASGKLSSIWALLLVAQGLLPVATVYLTRSVVNALVGAIRSGGDWIHLQHLVVLAAWVGGLMLTSQALRGATSWVRTAQAEMVRDHLASLIQKKSIEVDLAFYDSSDFYDHLHRARIEASYRPVELIEGLGTLLQGSVTAIAILAVLLPFGFVLPVALVLSAAPALYLVLKMAHLRHRWNRASTHEQRRSWYYDSLLTEGPNAAEMRLFGLGEHFAHGYESIRRKLRLERLSLARQESVSELLAGIATLAVGGAAMAWMTWRAMLGLVSLGDLALFYQAFNQGLNLSRTLLDNLGKLYENSLFLGNLFEFLDLKPHVVTSSSPSPVPRPLQNGIRFEDVTFSYPGTERPTLQGFSLDITPGQIVALVGPNGTGKSTFIKLLCRLYDPDHGRISIDGIPLTEFSLTDLRRSLSVFFQQPVHFNATATENIGYGDLTAPPMCVDERVRRAASAAGVEDVIARLPNGYATQLGRGFLDGAELSVGEWQRIALARAFARDAQILVLDEPTSAMDPWAELSWVERLRDVAAERTTILITHRLTTAMFADIIHVVADGRVAESGSHEQLLDRDGIYAQAWTATTKL